MERGQRDRLRIGKSEPGGHDPHDLGGGAVQLDGAAENGGVGSEAPPPSRVGEENHGGGLFRRILFEESTADPRLHLKDRKHGRRDLDDPDAVGLIPNPQVPLTIVEGAQGPEGRRELPVQPQGPGGVADVREIEAGRMVVDEDDPLGVGIRQRLDQHGIHHREDRHARSDAECERGGRDRRESRPARQATCRRVKIAPQIHDLLPTPHPASRGSLRFVATATSPCTPASLDDLEGQVRDSAHPPGTTPGRPSHSSTKLQMTDLAALDPPERESCGTGPASRGGSPATSGLKSMLAVVSLRIKWASPPRKPPERQRQCTMRIDQYRSVLNRRPGSDRDSLDTDTP